MDLLQLIATNMTHICTHVGATIRTCHFNNNVGEIAEFKRWDFSLSHVPSPDMVSGWGDNQPPTPVLKIWARLVSVGVVGQIAVLEFGLHVLRGNGALQIEG